MRIDEKFRELKVKKEGALIAYICVGDPMPQDTGEYIETLVRGALILSNWDCIKKYF